MKHVAHFSRSLPLENASESAQALFGALPPLNEFDTSDAAAFNRAVERISTFAGIFAFAGGLVATIYLSASIFF